MLMMKRRQGEAILIGDDIEIQLAHIGRSKVKLAIRAPRHLRVIAKEIQQVRNENQAAAELGCGTDLEDVISQIAAGGPITRIAAPQGDPRAWLSGPEHNTRPDPRSRPAPPLPPK